MIKCKGEVIFIGLLGGDPFGEYVLPMPTLLDASFESSDEDSSHEEFITAFCLFAFHDIR